MEPGGRSSGTASSRTEESHFVLVMGGSFVIAVNGSRTELTAGESLTFRGTDSYWWNNPSTETPCRVLWVLFPPQV